MSEPIDYDLFVIGGGINGVGIACDASGRGLSVGLCEMHDLASGTSSQSSKLIHGGLRYLEQYQFRLVREALAEREVLLKKAPHIITPLLFRLPHHPHLRPRWLIRLGLFLYDHLSRRVSLPASKSVLLAEPEGLIDSLQHGFEYADAKVDDARLVLLNALATRGNGGDIHNYCRCVQAQRGDGHWRLWLQHRGQDELQQITCKVLVNAAGPWLQQTYDEVLQRPCPKQMRLVKGSHIVVPRLNASDKAYLLQNTDGRIVFVIPYQQHYSLIGTTDEDYQGDPAAACIAEVEIDYLIQSVARYFKRRLRREEIVSHYAGVRPLFATQGQVAAAELSRDYSFELDGEPGQAALVSVFGGKITTYRKLSEAVVDSLAAYLPSMTGAWTASTVLPGGDFTDVAELQREFAGRYPFLPDDLLQRYLSAYGTRVVELLQASRCLDDLGEHFGAGLYRREVDYLMQQEWAVTAQDILWRRTKLGLQMSDTTSLENYMAASSMSLKR
ncbi:homodimeric glycerol 3-phosphate dehydrogenase (quinone) [Sinobacterium caligoides]|uniref:Glycerol-3-phosphate dehydrogenase n=1 Tax=Sinobacterium caligoides TaxID=933926 RepID=A0A3N2DPL3_9GAMM|nr:glycerol-3-phosphate dehydrogenase [Sinobacterium caligoides]ROS01726.1 homodimeric glycerol 3-phosphate dehydrogenase (quinone) [Sinobacterium caligoides]